MGKFKHYLFATFSLAILVGALAILGPEYGQAQGPPGGLDVTVVNIPLPVTGTITGTPDVNVVNTGSSPVPVTDVFTRGIYQEAGSNSIPGISNNVKFSVVPAGQLLVIETVSIRVELPTGQKAGEGRVSTVVGGLLTTHFFPTFEVGPAPGPKTIFAGSLHLRMYGEPGSVPEVGVVRDSTTGTGSMNATISGYLIPDTSPSLSP